MHSSRWYIAAEKESLSQGLKPKVVGKLNVRDKSRTYLRSNSKSGHNPLYTYRNLSSSDER